MKYEHFHSALGRRDIANDFEQSVLSLVRMESITIDLSFDA